MSSALETLRRDFGGDIIEPGGAEYESASRSVLASGSPAYVLRPASVGDVQAAVSFAAGAGLALSVRGGGHGFPGFGTNDGGVVIDLSQLATVESSTTSVTSCGSAAAPPGVRSRPPWPRTAWRSPSGDTKSVGVGGLTLTGGIGWKVRKYGLALDNVVAAEVVTADGEVVRASAEENPELFWAIRGGGGNFGIVTAFEFVAHPTTDVFYGKIAFPAAEAATVLQGWADYLRTAPEELTSIADFANPFAGGPEAPVEIHVAFDGDDPELAAEAIDPIRRLGTVIDDDVALKPYADIARGWHDPAAWHPARHPKRLRRQGIGARGPADPGRGRGVGAVAVHRRPQRRRCGVPSPRRRHRLRASPSGVDVRDHHRRVRSRSSTAARPALEAIWERLAPHVNGAYANFLDLCHRGGRRRDLSDGDLRAARGGQAPVRPRQPVRPQPQRPAPVGRRSRGHRLSDRDGVQAVHDHPFGAQLHQQAPAWSRWSWSLSPHDPAPPAAARAADPSLPSHLPRTRA